MLKGTQVFAVDSKLEIIVIIHIILGLKKYLPANSNSHLV